MASGVDRLVSEGHSTTSFSSSNAFLLLTKGGESNAVSRGTHAGDGHGPARHALARQSLRGVCAGQGPALGRSPRNLLHPQAWFLAEQGRDRVERADATGPSASATVPLW